MEGLVNCLVSMILHGDCLEKLKELPDNSVDAVVTDPPYGISFMGKQWDYDVPQVDVWKEVYRVLKPGAHMLVACGTRTQHRMTVNIEDAGFEIRDIVAWIYGSGFPKSLNIGKAVDKQKENIREIVGEQSVNDIRNNSYKSSAGRERLVRNVTKGNSPWEGWGTALKPAMELWTLARKPIEGTVAENVLKWGVGGLNIDGCRVGNEKITYVAGETGGENGKYGKRKRAKVPTTVLGRWPANLIHDGSEEVESLFPNDSQRFFYCAKAGKTERNKGLEGFEEKEGGGMEGTQDQSLLTGSGNIRNNKMQNFHPTVKPVSLMRYLCKLITPPSGTILDPFMGSGSTGIGAKMEGFNFIGIEREAEYVKIAEARIEAWEPDKQMILV